MQFKRSWGRQRQEFSQRSFSLSSINNMTDTLAQWHQPRRIQELGNSQSSWNTKIEHLWLFCSFCLSFFYKSEVFKGDIFFFFLRQEAWVFKLQFCFSPTLPRGKLVLSHWSHQFLLGLGFNRRALRVRLVTVVKRNSSSGSGLPFGWRFMKWTSCCLCVVREPFLGRPFLLKPRYHPLYLADTRAV